MGITDCLREAFFDINIGSGSALKSDASENRSEAAYSKWMRSPVSDCDAFRGGDGKWMKGASHSIFRGLLVLLRWVLVLCQSRGGELYQCR